MDRNDPAYRGQADYGPGFLRLYSDHLDARVLAPDGVLFGGTILGRSAGHGWLAQAFLRAVNRRGAFDNLDDTEAGIHEILQRSFRDVDLWTVGASAMFVAKGPVAAA